MTTATPTCGKAILLPCPCCNAEEVNIDVSLGSIDDEDAECFRCNECSVEFTIAQVRNLIKKWTRLLAWLTTAPDLDAE